MRTLMLTLAAVATFGLALGPSLPASAQVYYARPGAPAIIPHTPPVSGHPGIGFAIEDHDRYAYRDRRHYDGYRYGYDPYGVDRRQVYRYRAPRDAYPPFHGYDPGASVAAGIIGLATGMILGGGLHTPPAVRAPRGPIHDADAIAYCARKYRSFDPHSFTFLGYDGRRHYCQIP